MPPDLLTVWQAEETGQPEGWDFAHLAGRMSESGLPWDMTAEIREGLGQARHLLDMGTGGGEFLGSFGDLLPADTVATEGWAPNVPVAAEALAPLGVQVVEWAAPDDAPGSAPMPFQDGRFDLVVNRHESYDAAEVARVLAPGGTFLTQQVGGEEMSELHALTGKVPDNPGVAYDLFRSALEEAGLSIVAGGEDVGCYSFVDVAALVAYLQLVPWDVPDDFCVDRYAESLWQLHQAGPARGEPIELTRIRFWLRAVKPR